MSENQTLLRGHFSSCPELRLGLVSFLSVPLPFFYPFPYVMSMRNCCARTTPAFPLSVSSSEPAFQRKEIHKPFIHSFIQPFPAFSLFAKRAGSYLCLVTHHQIFMRGLCWTSLIHTLSASSEVNVLAAFACKYHTSTELLISRALSCFYRPW